LGRQSFARDRDRRPGVCTLSLPAMRAGFRTRTWPVGVESRARRCPQGPLPSRFLEPRVDFRPLSWCQRRSTAGHAIAVKLQLVRPGRPFRQCGNRQGEHRLDEFDLGSRDTHDSSVVVFKCRTQPTALDRRSGLPIRSVRNHLTESRAIPRLGLDLDCRR